MTENTMISTFTGLGYEPADWGRLPLAIRQRWWQETDYGKDQPGDELKAAIAAALAPHMIFVSEQHRIDDEAAP